MTGPGNYVLVAVARAREAWASDLARWSTSGAAPVELVKCLTADEARMVLGSGRRVSAVLIDARGPGVDRDLIDAAARDGVPTIVVSDRSVHRDWEALGCVGVIEHDPDPRVALERIARHCAPVDRSRRTARSSLEPEHGERLGRVVVVTGAGGSGTSTTAMALAQAAASPSGDVGAASVVLVDGGRRSDLAMYHDVGDVLPGLPELVEAHRSDRLDPDQVRGLTFPIDRRGYSVLLGRRRLADWVTLRRRSVEAALDALRRAHDLVVVDAEPDLDDQAGTGSPDVEDRHAVTLAALDVADVVLVTGRPGLHGLHAMVDLIGDVHGHGVPPHRVVPVLVGATRSPVARARLAATVDGLTGAAPDAAGGGIARPIVLGQLRHLDDVHDRVAALPDRLCRPLGTAVAGVLGGLGRRDDSPAPPAVRPGELATSSWNGADHEQVA